MTPEDRMKSLGSIDGSTPSEAEWLEFRTKAHRSVARRRIAGALGGAALLLAVVGGAYAMTSGTSDDHRGPGIAGTPTATESEPPTPDTSPSTDPEVPREFVFLQQWFLDEGKLDVFHIRFEKTHSPARDAIEMLRFVPGPLAEDGVETAMTDGIEILDLTIEDGVATIDFSEAYLADDRFYERQAQVVYTLTQFPTVQKVELLVEGTGPAATDVRRTDRSDFDGLLPPIVVEEPYAGEVVDRTFTMSGIANVFEANVSWRIVDQDGTVIDEGFTTATCGTGCWGTFEEEIRYTGVGNWAELQVFQSSAEDGSPMNMVTIPLNFEKAG